MRSSMNEIERGIKSLSYESVRRVSGDSAISKEAKERIYQKTLRRTGVSGRSGKASAVAAPRRGMRLKKPVTAAAALLLALSISAGAIVGAGRLSKRFGQFFRTLPEENYQGIIFDIDQSQTDNGVTVTLSQGMCDGTALYLIERVDFDASIATLTDDMFADLEDDYAAPFFSVEQVSHAVNDITFIERGYCKLLEHDAHSMMYLCVYGDGILCDFFRNDLKWVLNISNIENIRQNDKQQIICNFTFEFEAKLCEPTVYNLPEEIITFADNNDMNLESEDEPDVHINPWFMKILPGRQLNTELSSDKPILSITMVNGKVYTEQNGILLDGNPVYSQEMIGNILDISEGIYCTFDEEIDVTSIKSITLYGYQLTKAPVPEIKPLQMRPSVKEILPATFPVTVSCREKTVQVTELMICSDEKRGLVEKDIPSGSVKYHVNNINVYHNLYAAGADRKDILKLAIEDGKFIFYDYKGKLYGKGFSDACDLDDGEMKAHYYLVEYEIEMTNINASITKFEQNFFNMMVYCSYSPAYDAVDELIIVPTVYIHENDRKSSGRNDTFTLEKGQTRTFHVGFIVNDNHRGSLSQIGLSVGTEIEENPAFVNITKAVEKIEE